MAGDDEGMYELKDDGDAAEVRGAADGSGWKGPKPGDPDFVPPKVVVEHVVVKEEPAVAPEYEAPGEVADPEDVAKNKAMALLAYVCFLIPLAVVPTSKFARFHANQGLLSFILWVVAVVGVIVLWVLHWGIDELLWQIRVLTLFFGCAIYIAQPLLLIGALAMTVTGLVHAANGEMKGLPIIGTFRLIK